MERYSGIGRSQPQTLAWDLYVPRNKAFKVKPEEIEPKLNKWLEDEGWEFRTSLSVVGSNASGTFVELTIKVDRQAGLAPGEKDELDRFAKEVVGAVRSSIYLP